jgi:hypothetical protein
MADDDGPKITTRLRDKKLILAALGVTALFIVVLIVAIVFYGALAGDPRGEDVFPGP